MPITATRRSGLCCGLMSLGQELSLGLQPLAEDPSAHLTTTGPYLWEAIAGHVVALNAERVLDDADSAVAVTAVNRLLEKIGHVTSYSPLAMRL